MASVTYRIQGKYDNKGVKAAQKGFEDLSKSVKQIGTVVKGFAVAEITKVISQLSNQAKETFLTQNKALVQFNTAVAKSTLSLQKLQAIQNKVSRNNLFDGDVINNAMSYAVQLGLTEEQIEKVMKAATDLSASGIMPLDQAVKNLSLTYSGNINSMKKLMPELADFSKKQLKNGDAIDYVAEKYKGFADVLQNSFSGRDTQWNNAISDLKAEVGKLKTSFEFIMQGKLLSGLNDITSWFNQNSQNIIKTVIALPKLFDVAMQGVKKFFTLENLTKLFSDLASVQAVTLKHIFTLASDLISTLLTFLSNGIYKIFEDTSLQNLIKNVLTGNGGKDQIERQKKANEILQNAGISFKEQMSLTDERLEALGLERVGGKNSKTYATKRETPAFGQQAVEAKLSTLANDVTILAKDGKAFYGSIWNNLKEIFTDDTDNLVEQMKNIIATTDLPPDLKDALELGVTALSGIAEDVGGSGTGAGEEEKQKNTILDAVLGASGELGNVISAALMGGPLGVITYLIGDLVGRLASNSEVINGIVNFLSTIYDSVLAPLVYIVEALVGPMLPLLRQIAMITGKALELFAPIFGVIGDMLRGLLSIVSVILTGIYNAVVAIHNFFTKKKNHWDYMDAGAQAQSLWDDSYSATMASSASASSGGGSYTAARDIYVNVIYNNSYVNGDARMIALSIRDEITAAEKLGY